VRCGTSRGGLPIGVQLVAGPWRDDVALAAALRLEHDLGGWQAPAGLTARTADRSARVREHNHVAAVPTERGDDGEHRETPPAGRSLLRMRRSVPSE
jgi:hypothetical protein